jgi:DNA-3-methyladenine glycosylase
LSAGAALGVRRVRRAPALPREFYDRATEIVARELLGTVLECETDEGLTSGRIVETEAYLGPHDPACHGSFKRSARTDRLFGPPGTAYIYFIYGVHWCFNAVTLEEGHPSAVLVRALEPLQGIELMRARRGAPRRDVDLTNGPGKLCRALGIDGRFDGVPLQRPPVTLRPGTPVPDADVVVTPRIGITKAAELPLRWLVRGSAFVSRTPRHFTQSPLAT